MTIKISSTFLNDLNNYAEYLINEGVTKDIVNERVENIKSFINTLTKNSLYYPICRYKDLGQEFSENKEFIHQNLRQESYYPTKNKKVYWAFSFFLMKMMVQL